MMLTLFLHILVALVDLASSQNGPILTPSLSKIQTIVSDPNANIRDPTAVLFDHVTKTWNFWATHIPIQYGTAGYHGTIHHYYSKSLNSTFNTSGIAINISSNPNDFDSFGVFTPGVTYDNTTNEWIIFYGGVKNGSSSHIEQIGIAVSTNGVFGPFIKNTEYNPVVKLTDVFWCDNSGPARVDEAKPSIVGNKKYLYVKGVCNNFTALEGIWEGTSKTNNNNSNNTSWSPPYSISSQYSPLFNSLNTTDKLGFENFKIFLGIDGYLHLTGHNHGSTDVNGTKIQECPHYVSINSGDDDNEYGIKWKFVNMMKSFGQHPDEPAPVYPNGAPGDEGGIPTYFIQFVQDGKKPLYVDLMSVQWN